MRNNINYVRNGDFMHPVYNYAYGNSNPYLVYPDNTTVPLDNWSGSYVIVKDRTAWGYPASSDTIIISLQNTNSTNRGIIEQQLGDDEYKEYFSRNYSGTEYTSYYDTLFTQETNDDFNWSFNDGPTGSNRTGPSSGYGGSGYYIYTEASSPNFPNKWAILRATFVFFKQQRFNFKFR